MRISDWSSDVCSSDLRIEACGIARTEVLQRAEGADAILGNRGRGRKEARRLVNAIAMDEGGAFGAGEFHGDLACKPAFEIETGIVEHRLARRRIGVELAAGRGDFGKLRRACFGARGSLADPARCGERKST